MDSYSFEEYWKQYCIEQIPKLKERYKELMGYDFDIDNPKTLSEKIQWLKIYDSTLLKTVCSDKIAVRKYVESSLNDSNLFIPILAEYENFSEINFSKLPSNYVLKTNHGSHTNIIVKNKNIDIEKAKNKFSEWLSKDWTWWGYEMAYKHIHRKIFAEKFVTDGHSSLIDYKFLCFNGDPIYCQVIGNRNSNNKFLNYYNMDWKPCLDISRIDFKANYMIKIDKPYSFENMKDISRHLANKFKFVRIDFYEIDKRCYLSELTFFPGSGFIEYENNSKVNLQLGNLLNLA